MDHVLISIKALSIGWLSRPAKRGIIVEFSQRNSPKRKGTAESCLILWARASRHHPSTSLLLHPSPHDGIPGSLSSSSSSSTSLRHAPQHPIMAVHELLSLSSSASEGTAARRLQRDGCSNKGLQRDGCSASANTYIY
jgi:hypothetical protein